MLYRNSESGLAWEVTRCARDFGCGLPPSLPLRLTPANRLKFESIRPTIFGKTRSGLRREVSLPLLGNSFYDLTS